MKGRFAEQSESTIRAVNEGRDITLAMADMFSNELREMELDGAAFELAAYATFGAAASATDWWLGSRDTPRRLPSDRFIDYLTTIMMGSINGTCEVLDVPEALDAFVEYFRNIAGEHPDWDEYRAAMARQGKSLLRVTITGWGPIATGGFPAEVIDKL